MFAGQQQSINMGAVQGYQLSQTGQLGMRSNDTLGTGNKVINGKCKEQGHIAKNCKILAHCIICGKD